MRPMDLWLLVFGFVFIAGCIDGPILSHAQESSEEMQSPGEPSTGVTLHVSREVNYFLKVPQEEAAKYLPDGWPATCHTPVAGNCQTDGTGTVSDLWWLVVEFSGGQVGDLALAPGSMGLVLVETRAQGDLEEPRSTINHEFVPVETFTDEPTLHEWLSTWDLSSADSPVDDIEVTVTGSTSSTWLGEASGSADRIDLDAKGLFLTAEPLGIEGEDSFRIFSYDPETGGVPNAFLSFRTAYVLTDGGISLSSAVRGHVPGFSDDEWVADAGWIGSPHTVELTFHQIP